MNTTNAVGTKTDCTAVSRDKLNRALVSARALLRISMPPMVTPPRLKCQGDKRGSLSMQPREQVDTDVDVGSNELL